jgi:hypothetical protein
MANKTYYEKLKDPRWQKKRLEVMERNEFSCEICSDTETTLNVHHKEYFKGADPWDYEVEQLACICENCHEAEHGEIDLLKWVCSYARLDGPENREELAILLAGYMGITTEKLNSVMPYPFYPDLADVYEAGRLTNHHMWERRRLRINSANENLNG